MAPRPSSEGGPSSRSSSKRPKLRFVFLTLFPEVFPPVLGSSLLGKADQKGIVGFETVNPRDFALDKHRTVDDTPYGGGAGMLMRADVLYAAWKKATSRKRKALTILLSPQGEPFSQAMAHELAEYSTVVLVCGHYEGVDERFIDLCVDREVSVGDYVLTGGELPALVIADTVTRLVPGVVGNEKSLSDETFENGLLKYPQYTRPREFRGRTVPEVLLGGNHKAISQWRQTQMEERTLRKRPDLFEVWKTKT